MLKAKDITIAKDTDEDYFANPAISNSDLTYFRQNGYANFWNYKYGEKPRISTPQLTLGSLIHCKILEPDEVDDRFCCFTGKKPNSPNKENFANDILLGKTPRQAYLANYKVDANKIEGKDEALYEELYGYIEYLKTSSHKTAVDADTWGIAELCVQSFYKRKEEIYKQIAGANPIKESVKEMTIYGKLCGVDCRVKVDEYLETIQDNLILVDLKTTSASNQRSFEASIVKYGYLAQMAFYRAFLRAFDQPVIDDPFIIAIQTSAPYPVQCYRISGTLLDRTEEYIERDLNMLYPYLGNPDSLLTAEQTIITLNESNFRFQS